MEMCENCLKMNASPHKLYKTFIGRVGQGMCFFIYLSGYFHNKIIHAIGRFFSGSGFAIPSVVALGGGEHECSPSVKYLKRIFFVRANSGYVKHIVYSVSVWRKNIGD